MTISPWHGVTTVAMGNCGFGVAPTRPEHRGHIMRTLEKVEGMSLAALEAGLGYEWPFETFPEYLDAIERRGTAINAAALVGHTPVRIYVMGEEANERTATPAKSSGCDKSCGTRSTPARSALQPPSRSRTSATWASRCPAASARSRRSRR